MARTVAVDFDGVIHAYSKGWHDGTAYDGPVPGALDGLRSLIGKYAVVVFTTRNPIQVIHWFRTHAADIPVVADLDEEQPTFWNDTAEVLVTNRKLPAVAYIDDRAIRFESWDQALADLAAIGASDG